MMKKFKNYEISTPKPGKTPLLERITSAYLKGEECELSDDDEQILKRWKVVRMLEFQHRPCISRSNIIKALMTDFGISEFTASKDIVDAHKLFGSVEKVNREFKLMMYMEWQEQLASLCEAKGDFDGASKALERAATLMEKLKGDEENAQGDRYYQMNLFFGNNEKFGKKTIDLNAVEELPATEFKDLIKAVDHPRVDLEMMELLLDKHNSKNEGATD